MFQNKSVIIEQKQDLGSVQEQFIVEFLIMALMDTETSHVVILIQSSLH